MSILKASNGSSLSQCDGCGRTDGGPGVELGIRTFTVHDPNVGGAVQHHYCSMCAANRGAQGERLELNWATSAPAVQTAESTPEEQLNASLPAPVEEAAAAAEQIEESGGPARYD
jgi:hypothetical protein